MRLRPEGDGIGPAHRAANVGEDSARTVTLAKAILLAPPRCVWCRTCQPNLCLYSGVKAPLRLRRISRRDKS